MRLSSVFTSDVAITNMKMANSKFISNKKALPWEAARGVPPEA